MRLLLIGVLLLATSNSHAERRADLNDYVLKAVEYLAKNHGNKGYTRGGVFTHELDWKQKKEIPPNKKPYTMCVAAVTEVLVTALEMYARENDHAAVFEKVPARRWYKSSRRDLRPYLFLYDTVKSNGTADALRQFGMGAEIPFSALRPGDFINFNRNNRTGHAVVFIHYIDAKGDEVKVYNKATVVGFKYFSSQGNETNGGLSYRWAYFDKKCPSVKVQDRPRDCGIYWSPQQKLLNTGYLLHPNEWTIELAQREMDDANLKEIRPHARFDQLSRLPSATRLQLQKDFVKRMTEEPQDDRTPASYDGTTLD